MRIRPGSLASGLLLATLLAPAAEAGVPDPSQSTCSFPSGSQLACPDPVAVSVTLRDAFGVPVPDCGVIVEFVIAVGSLDDEQVLSVSGVTGPAGEATLVFEEGVLGNALVFLVISATCDGDIGICVSPTPYTVQCTPPTKIDPETWGRVKLLYL